jgi:putative aldouronate transport system substrate-binding protein
MKKTVSLLLALLLVIALFVGCSEKPEPTPTSVPTATPSSEQTQEPGNDEPGLVYPMLTEETTEISVWQTFTANYIASMNDSDFVKYVEELTNIRMVFKEASSSDAVTAYNLMLTSGDYTDVVRPAGTVYPGGPDRAVEDGVFLKLNDYIENFAPNYAARRTASVDVARQTITDNGNIWSMYTLNDPAEYPWMGLALRTDILDKHSIRHPVTLADWELALQTFKDEGIKAPLLLDISGVFLNSEFLSAYQIGKEFFNKGGQVQYGYVQPEFKDYLIMMNDWYNKGLIDSEFVSRGVNFAIFGGDALSMTLNGEAGAGLFPWGYTDNTFEVNQQTLIEGFRLGAVSNPVLNEGDTIKLRYTSWEAKMPNAITTACDNPELVVKFLDYFFTDEGAMLINFGREGESFTMVDGQPRYVDFILENPDGFSGRDVAMNFTWDDGIGMSDFRRLWQYYQGKPNEGALGAYEVWNQDSNEYLMPVITMTAEEGDRHNAIYADIQGFVTEKIPQFIMGSLSIDEFDSFVAEIYGMGLEECLQIQQDALDRYNAR